MTINRPLQWPNRQTAPRGWYGSIACEDTQRGTLVRSMLFESLAEKVTGWLTGVSCAEVAGAHGENQTTVITLDDGTTQATVKYKDIWLDDPNGPPIVEAWISAAASGLGAP